MTKESKEKRLKSARQYVKDNVWKRVLLQKLGEFALIPVIIYLPIWVGRLLVKIIGDERVLRFLNSANMEREFPNIINSWNCWGFGSLFIFFLAIIILANYVWARGEIENKAVEKYDVDHYDMRYTK